MQCTIICSVITAMDTLLFVVLILFVVSPIFVYFCLSYFCYWNCWGWESAFMISRPALTPLPLALSLHSLCTHTTDCKTHTAWNLIKVMFQKKEGSQDVLVLNFWPQSLQIAHFQREAGIPLLPSHLPVPLPLPPPLVKRWQKSCCLAARLEGPHIICWAVLPPPFLTTNFPKSKRSLLVYLLYQMLTLAMVE